MVRDVKAASGIKERDYVLLRGLKKCSFVNEVLGVACTRLLARQGLPFVNEFPERQHYQGLSAQGMCVYVITCISTCLQGEEPLTELRESKTEECLLGTAAGISLTLFLLFVMCIRVLIQRKRLGCGWFCVI